MQRRWETGMLWQITPYTWVLVASAAITASLGIFAWRQRPGPGAMPFAVTMGMGALWACTNALEMADTQLPGKLFWANLQYLSSAFMPVTWLATILEFTRKDDRIKGRRIVWLCVVPAITVVLVWSNDLHGLMRREIFLDTAGDFPVVGKTYGPWFWVHTAYSYAILLTSVPSLVGMILRTPGAIVGQPMALLTGFLFPIMGNLAYVVGLSPIRRLDITPALFGLSGVVVSWALFRYKLFELVPLARDRVFEAMADGVIVLDARGKIIDLNRAARTVLGAPSSESAGPKIGHRLDAWPDLADICQRSPAGRTEIAFGTGEASRHYEVQISPVIDRRGRVASRVVSFRDIGERKWGQAQWLQQQRTLAMLEARERLEREIAEALHSRVQSKLLVAWHQLGECEKLLGAGPDKAAKLLSETRRLIDEIRERDIKQASSKLHPSILSLGLIPAIRTLAEGFEAHFRVATHIDPQVMELDSPLQNYIPEFMRLVIYRVLEEALNNVHLHAQATRVDIWLGIDDEKSLTLLVEDDGCGFDTAHMKRGLGLSGIAGRVEETGGLLKIASSVGQGTVISTLFPSFDQWGLE